MENNLLVAGFGGQGVMTLGKLIAACCSDNTTKEVTFFPSYGAEQRGGTANCFVVTSTEPIGNPVGDAMDEMIIMNGPALDKFLPLLKEGGTLYVNSSIVKKEILRTDIHIIKAPITELSLKLGNPKVLNIIMLGVYIGHSKLLEPKIVAETLKSTFAGKPHLIDLNLTAFQQGLTIGQGVTMTNVPIACN